MKKKNSFSRKYFSLGACSWLISIYVFAQIVSKYKYQDLRYDLACHLCK